VRKDIFLMINLSILFTCHYYIMGVFDTLGTRITTQILKLFENFLSWELFDR